MGFAELLLPHGQSNEPNTAKELRGDHQERDVIITAGQYIVDLLDDFLDFAKLKSGTVLLRDEPFSFTSLCHEMERLVAHMAHDGVHLQVDVPVELWIRGDRLRWKQLLMNMLLNALKFTKRGEVVLRASLTSNQVCSTQDSKQFDASSDSSDSNPLNCGQGATKNLLLLEVIDTGPGVSEEQAGKLFIEWSRLHGHSGHGLGLVIANHIARLMQTEVKLRSPYKADGSPGSLFYWTTKVQVVERSPTQPPPVMEEAALGAHAEESGEQPAGGSDAAGVGSIIGSAVAASEKHALRVLVVDDDAMNRLIMQAKLAQCFGPQSTCGCQQEYELQIEAMETGEQVLEQWTQCDPHGAALPSTEWDLILMDEHLSDDASLLRGSDVIRKLREGGCSAVVISCSGNCTEVDQALYLKSGANYCWCVRTVGCGTSSLPPH
jgi:CheY-like chemotaxis protein